MLYSLVTTILGVVFRLFYRWRVVGRENLPKRGGCVVVANHCNFADPLVLGSVLYPVRITRFMAKAELFKVPGLGLLLRGLHAFPVRRGVGDRQAVKSALEVVRQGHVLGLFPEGTRFRDGRLHELRRGAAMVHLATGAPVIPVGLAGTGKMKLFRLPALAVFIGEPLRISRVEGPVEKRAIAAVNALIQEGLERVMAEAGKLNERRGRA